MEAVFIDIHTHGAAGNEHPSRLLQVHNVALNHQEEVHVSPSTAGLHPWYVDPIAVGAAFEKLVQLLEQKAIIGIGECGLDKVTAADLSLQQDVFSRQIELAKSYHVPLVVHCVRAFQEVLQSLVYQKYAGHVIFHGYQKNIVLARTLLQKGYFLSFGHYILQGRLDDVLKEIPLEQLFLETDTASTPIESIYDYVARVRNQELSTLKEQLFKNYQSVFH
jgi:TatD DNase family protein